MVNIRSGHDPGSLPNVVPIISPGLPHSPILASELTANDTGDSSMVGRLLDQIQSPITPGTADGSYDGEPVYRAIVERQPQPPPAVIIPPRATAVPSSVTDTAPSLRDRHIQMIQEKGRLGWQRAVGYGKRALVETAMFRYKVLIGPHLRALYQRRRSKPGSPVPWLTA